MENLELFKFFGLDFIIIKKSDEHGDFTTCKLCGFYGFQYVIYNGKEYSICNLCSGCSKISTDFNFFLDWYLSNKCLKLENIDFHKMIIDLIEIMIINNKLYSTLDHKNLESYIKSLPLGWENQIQDLKYDKIYLTIKQYKKIHKYIYNITKSDEINKLIQKHLSKYLLNLREYYQYSSFTGFFGKCFVQKIKDEGSMSQKLKLLKLVSEGYFSSFDWFDYDKIHALDFDTLPNN